MSKITTKVNTLLANQLINPKKKEEFKKGFSSFLKSTEKAGKLIQKKFPETILTDAKLKKVFELKILKNKATYVSISRWTNACEVINFKVFTDIERKWSYDLMVLLQTLISSLNKKNKGWQNNYKKVFTKCTVFEKLSPNALSNYKCIGIDEIYKISKLVHMRLIAKPKNTVGIVYSYILYLIEHLEKCSKTVYWSKPEILKVEQLYYDSINDLVPLHKIFSSSRTKDSLKAGTYFDAQNYRLQKIFSNTEKNPAEKVEEIWDYFSELAELNPKEKRMKVLNKEFIDSYFGFLYEEMENRKTSLSKEISVRFIKFLFDNVKKKIDSSETQDTVNTLLIILTVVIFLNTCI